MDDETLKEHAAWLATHLLGWERQPDAEPTHVDRAGPVECWKHPDGTYSYGSGTVLHLTTGNGMLEILKAAGKRGLVYILESKDGDRGWVCLSMNDDDDVVGQCVAVPSSEFSDRLLPIAVLECTYAALSEGKDTQLPST